MFVKIDNERKMNGFYTLTIGLIVKKRYSNYFIKGIGASIKKNRGILEGFVL